MANENYTSAPIPDIGSRVLVRLNFCDEQGNIVEERQFFGVIDRITAEEVIIKDPESGKEVSLPPHFGSYEKPPKGEYPLASTGETVTDPDYVTEWTVRVSSGH